MAPNDYMENTRSNSYALKCTPSWEAGWTLPPSHSTLPTRWATPFPCIHAAYFAPTLPVTEPLGLSMLCLSNLYAMVKHWPKTLPICSAPHRDTGVFHSTPGEEERAAEKSILGENLFHITFWIVCVFVSVFAFWERIPLNTDIRLTLSLVSSYLLHC